MRLAASLVLALASVSLTRGARADIIPPAVEECDGKRIADACSSEEGFGLDAFGGEPAKRFEGHCAPIEHHRTGTQMLICQPGAAPAALAASAAPAQSASAPPLTPSSPPPSAEPASRGCACRFVPARDLSGAGVALGLAALALARRRRA